MVFYVFHQGEPEVYTLMDFTYEREEIYLVHWYVNWRKLPAINNSWRAAASHTCVPMPIMETARSLLCCQNWIEKESLRKPIFSILGWHMYDSEKNEKKTAELVRSYCLDDPSQIMPVLMGENKKYWEHERVFQWNTGIMDDDGNVCSQKQLRAKLGHFTYDYTSVHKRADFLGVPMLEDVVEKKAEEEARVYSD